MAGSSKGSGGAAGGCVPDERVRSGGEELSKAAALRELEKARVRECQMEKTVRWWTVCTAGWRKKWSKLRQENEELRKQMKAYKSQLGSAAQDCNALNGKLEYCEAHNAYLKGELNKLLLKYGHESEERITEILDAPDIIKPKVFTCSECRSKSNEAKTATKSVSTPNSENLFLEPEHNDGSTNECKNVEIFNDIISKYFSDLLAIKGDYGKNEDEPEKEIPTDTVQISQVKLLGMIKDLLKKLDNANNEIAMLHTKMEEMAMEDLLLDAESKIELQKLTLSDDE